MQPYRFSVVFALFLGASTALGADPPDTVAKSDPRTPLDERKAFHLPEGFDIELVASEPDIHKPMNIAFDDMGRLWVTETVEYPFPVGPGKVGRDGVKILSDFGPDGKARKIEAFADGLNIPIGLLPMPTDSQGKTSALVYSIPQILKISADGKTQEPLYSTYGTRDTHGMTNAFTWGFDGWIYATHGYSNTSTVQGSDKKPITMQSGNTYRMKSDGSHLEYYCHGQVNPFGLAFDPLGYLYSSDCHSRPVYQLLRGAWYPSFGTKDDGIGLGPEMATHDHGSTGIAGIVYYAADHFPEAFRDNLFVGNVVTNRVNRDTIEWHGSSPKAIEQPDFVVSDDPWFRPVDLKLGPDGAMYIADFYNRIIGHYEVPLTHPGRDRERGRIWRVVYRGKSGSGNAPAIPRLITSDGIAIKTLKSRLASPNLTVRLLAANRLTIVRELHPNSMDDLLGPEVAPPQKIGALWVLQRRQSILDKTEGPHFRESEKQRLGQVMDLRRLPAELKEKLDREEENPIPLAYLTKEILTKAAHDSDRTVRVHTMRILGERPELAGTFAEFVREAIKDTDPHVRRAAADTLGRHPDTANIKLLLALKASTPADDTHLIHVARMALRDQLLGDETWIWLDKQSLTDAELAGIADVTTGVPTAAAARFLFGHINKHQESPENLIRYVHHIARYGDPAQGPKLLFFLQADKSSGILGQVALMKAYQQGIQERGGQLSADDRKFALVLTTALLDSPHANEVLEGIGQAAAFRLDGVRDKLAALASNGKAPEPNRARGAFGLVGDRAEIGRADAEEGADGLVRAVRRPRTGRELARIGEPGRGAGRALEGASNRPRTAPKHHRRGARRSETGSRSSA